ncbi:DUF4306 domain-containing protein [Bacillus sp. ISL-53]|nr:DUF4306 domain-containing protein [Bacillus sp. ISL-53]MBT2606658.1 DUF4306 domain-containing protein [Bacillus sp. ISL-53]
MTKYIIQILLSVIFLAISSIASWYEGSEILERPWEWENTAHFSHMFNAEVTNVNDISELDFFVYSAKIKPVFPFIMIISFLYLIILIGKILLRDHKKGFNIFLAILGCLLLIPCLFLINSPTTGGKVFMFTFSLTGLMCILFSLNFYLKKLKG